MHACMEAHIREFIACVGGWVVRLSWVGWLAWFDWWGGWVGLVAFCTSVGLVWMGCLVGMRVLTCTHACKRRYISSLHAMLVGLVG